MLYIIKFISCYILKLSIISKEVYTGYYIKVINLYTSPCVYNKLFLWNENIFIALNI